MTKPAVKDPREGIQLIPGDTLVCDVGNGSLWVTHWDGRTMDLTKFAELIGDEVNPMREHLIGIDPAAFWATAAAIAITHSLWAKEPQQKGSMFTCELAYTRPI